MTINQLDEKLSQLWAEAPVKYAFGNEQFNEMLKEFGISGMEEAKEKLYRMNAQELIEAGYVNTSDVDDVEGEVIEKTLRVRAFDIEYDIEEDDYDDKEEYIQIINSLPTELEVEITVDKDLAKY